MDQPHLHEPTISCPNCSTEIKLTGALAAPLIAATRREFEAKLIQKETDVAAREKVAQRKVVEAEQARASINDQVAAGVARGRDEIAALEAAKARQLLSVELAAGAKALADAQAVLKDRDERLAKAAESEAMLVKRHRELDDQKRDLELTIERRLKDQADAAHEQLAKQLADKDAALAVDRQKIVAEEGAKAKQLLAGEIAAKDKQLADAGEILRDREEKLAKAQLAEAETLKRQRELDDKARELELTIETRVRGEVDVVRVKAKQDAEDALSLKISERDERIAGMTRQIEELKRKAEQGSQQLQGEALELHLESTLKTRFPMDSIEPVAKGEFGGDVVQKVYNQAGILCGTILWETKRTKNWSDGWLAKMREDQRQAKADMAILISDVLPKPVEAFDQVEGVWVTGRRCAFPVATALRQALFDLQNSRQVQDGQQSKMELLYAYLTGSRFRHRIEAIVEKFGDMQADLQREKKATIRLWAKREAQIQGVIEATVGMYGDMQGIAGRAMLEIPAIEVPLIDAAPVDQGKLDV